MMFVGKWHRTFATPKENFYAEALIRYVPSGQSKIPAKYEITVQVKNERGRKVKHRTWSMVDSYHKTIQNNALSLVRMCIKELRGWEYG